jgi:hypothetical protein
LKGAVIRVIVTGWDAQGVVVKTAERIFNGEDPQPLELSGFIGLKKFRAAMRLLWTENGTAQENLVTMYVDDIKFTWC